MVFAVPSEVLGGEPASGAGWLALAPPARKDGGDDDSLYDLLIIRADLKEGEGGCHHTGDDRSIHRFRHRDAADISFILAGSVSCISAEDVLGQNRGHVPRHAKVNRNFASEYDRLQAERIAAFREFHEDVQAGAYPEERHKVAVPQAELDAFLKRIS